MPSCIFRALNFHEVVGGDDDFPTVRFISLRHRSGIPTALSLQRREFGRLNNTHRGNCCVSFAVLPSLTTEFHASLSGSNINDTVLVSVCFVLGVSVVFGPHTQ